MNMDGDLVAPQGQQCGPEPQQCPHNTAGVAATTLPPSSLTLTLTLAQVHAIVKQLDPQLEVGDETYKAAVCLLSTLTVGAHAGRVAKFTGYPYDFVAPLAWRWRANKIWVRRRRLPAQICHSGWGDPETGGIAFWCDVMVGTGMLARQLPEGHSANEKFPIANRKSQKQRFIECAKEIGVDETGAAFENAFAKIIKVRKVK